MTIETRYQIGDFVWTFNLLKRTCPLFAKVEKITITITHLQEIYIDYRLWIENHQYDPLQEFPESFLFKTRDECVEYYNNRGIVE